MLMQLFLAFLQVGAFSVGGGYAAIPLIQSLAVDTHGWLSLSEFTNLVTIAEMTPGPIAVNAATFVGIRMAGIPGAIAATMGCIAPSLVLVTLLSYIYTRTKGGKGVQMVLSVLRATVVALIASAAITLGKGAVTVEGSWFVPGAVILAAALVVLRWKKCSPIWVLMGCGAAGAVVHAVGLG